MTKYLLVVLSLLMAMLAACGQNGPIPIYYGEDNCANCRMTIVDQQFGCEILTDKGKVFKFDSIECLAAYESKHSDDRQKFASAWVTDFQSTGVLIGLDEAHFVRSASMRSPMGVGLFAFSSGSDAESFAQQHDGLVLDFEAVKLVVDEVW